MGEKHISLSVGMRMFVPSDEFSNYLNKNGLGVKEIQGGKELSVTYRQLMEIVKISEDNMGSPRKTVKANDLEEVYMKVEGLPPITIDATK